MIIMIIMIITITIIMIMIIHITSQQEQGPHSFSSFSEAAAVLKFLNRTARKGMQKMRYLETINDAIYALCWVNWYIFVKYSGVKDFTNIMSVGWVGYLRRSRSLSARRAQRITSIKHKINISITCKRNTNLGDGSLETLMVWTYLEVILAFPWREEVYRKGILTCHRIQLLQHPDPTLHWSNQSPIPIWQYMASMQSWKCLLSFRSKIKLYFGQIFNRIGGYSPPSLSRWLSTRN